MALSVGSLIGYLRLEGGAQFDRGVASARGEMSGAAQSAQRMAGAMAKAEANLARAGRQSNLAAEGAAKLRVSQLSLLAATERYNTLLGQESASLRQLALAEAAVIRANESVRASTPAAAIRETTAAADRSAGVMARTAGSMAMAAKSAIGLGAAFGAFELVKHAIDSGKELTTALNGVQAVSRATDEQMKAVRAQAIGLGKDLTVPGATAVDAANAIEELVKAGIKLPRAMDAARPALLLAAATQSNMADTARVLGDTMDIWAIKGQGAAHAANIIGAATLSASHDLLGFFDEVKQAGPSAQALGINLDDTSAALVYLAKSGLGMSAGGAAVKTFLTNLTKDIPKAKTAMADLGVTAFDAQGKFVGFPKIFDQLHAANIRFGSDKDRFLKDLNAAFGVRSQSAAALFGRATGAAYDEVLAHLESGDLQKAANTMNRGVAASFRQVQKELTAAGIDAYSGAEPAFTALLSLIGKGVPAAVALGAAAIHPFAAAWHLVDAPVGATAHALADVMGYLHPLAPLLQGAGAAALTMYAAFKGYQIVRAAAIGIADGVGALTSRMNNGLIAAQNYGSGVGATFAGSATAAERAALEQEAASAQVSAAAAREAADVEAAKAAEAEAYAALVAASEDASAKQIAASQNAALAAQTQAEVAEASAVETAAAAETSATAVVAAGDEAAIGWAGLAGPLGIAAIGVLSLVTMFHKSTTASKEAKDAAKSYADLLSGGGTKADFVDAITKQLKSADVPAEIAKINAGLGRATVNSTQFVNAISSGDGKPLATLRAQLEGIVKAGTVTTGGQGAYRQVTTITPAAQAAAKALKSLNIQNNALSSAARTELLNFKTFGVVAGAIGKTTTATHLGTQAAQQYAVMAGLQVDKNGIVAKSQDAVEAAVKGVSDAYATATQSGSAYLDALNTFSKSTGTASDRATMIGATLKAANGDALSYAAALNAGATATHQLSSDMASAAKSVGKSGVSVRSFMASIVNLKRGTIDYSNAAAAPLISDLQGMQTAAMNAASAMYQHEVATKGAKTAADDAYTRFQALTSGALVGQAKQLSITKDEAQKLATTYFGMPKDVKTAIEAEGTDPVVTVLNKIGRLLATLTGQAWDAQINVSANISPSAIRAENLLNNIRGSDSFRITNKSSAPGFAQGTGTSGLPRGLSSVGEEGPELAYNDGSKTHIIPNGRARQIASALGSLGVKMPGFAKGTPGSVAATQAWLQNTVNPMPYVWGAAGPRAWDCSGLVGGVIEHLTGRGSGRLFSTSNEGAVLKSLGFKRGSGGANALMVAGWNSEHTTGSVGGLRFEAYGSDGVPLKDQIRVGSKARDPKSFPNTMYLPNGADGVQASTKPGGNPKGGAATAVSTAAASAKLFGGASGGSIGSQLISGVSNSPSAIGVSSASSAASRAAVAGHSAAVVNGAIAGSVSPDQTQAQLITSLPKTITGAFGAEQRAEISSKNYATLAANVTKLKAAVTSYVVAGKQQVNTWRDSADTLTKQARGLDAQAAKMATSTKAEKASKKAVEDQAAALRRRAADYRTDATEATRNSAAGKAALQAQLTAAQTLAARAKDAYGTISQAAKDAASKAADYAKQLVDSVKASADALTSSITDFASSITSGLTQGTDLASVWGSINDAATAAAASTAELTSAQAAQSNATSTLTAAQQQLAAAQAAVAAGHGTPAQYAALTAAQQAQTTALTVLTMANNNLATAQQSVASSGTAVQGGLAGLQAQFDTILANTQNFAADLKQLAAEGADQSFVAQIAGMGTTAGDALAQQLLAAGPTGIKALQTTLNSIQKVAGDAGTQLAGTFYSSGANSMVQFIQGLESKFPSLTSALQAIATAVATAAGVKAPTVPKVTAPKTATKAKPKAGTVTHPIVVKKKYALGTNYASDGIALVGELGPELVRFRGGEQVINNRNLDRIVGKPATGDFQPVVRRLESIERAITATPNQTGQVVAAAGAGLYAHAGASSARYARRARRRRGGF